MSLSSRYCAKKRCVSASAMVISRPCLTQMSLTSLSDLLSRVIRTPLMLVVVAWQGPRSKHCLMIVSYFGMFAGLSLSLIKTLTLEDMVVVTDESEGCVSHA